MDNTYKPELRLEGKFSQYFTDLEWIRISSMNGFPWHYVAKKLDDGKGRYTTEEVYDMFNKYIFTKEVSYF